MDKGWRILRRWRGKSDGQIRRERPHSPIRAAKRARPRAAEFRVPDATLAALGRIFGEPAGEVRVVEHSRHWTFWHPRVSATTRPGRILLRGSGEEFLRDPVLVLEEYYHVLRQWKTGELTRARYLLQAVRHGYAGNRFEVEAKRFARGLEHALRRAGHAVSAAARTGER